MDNPLHSTLRHIAPLGDLFNVEIGTIATDWFPAADLIQPLSPLLAEGLERAGTAYEGIQPRTRASFFIGNYAWYVPAFAIACYLSVRRVPCLAPENIALRYHTYTWHHADESGESEKIEVRLLTGQFAALPNDPARDAPDAIILPDEAALRTQLRLEIERHVAPLIEQIYIHTRFSRRAQWNLVADSCASLFLYIGTLLDNAEFAQAEGLAFVKAAASPLLNPNTGYFTLEWNGNSQTFRARGGCCRYYTLPDKHKCSTCVLRPTAERDTLLLNYMASK